MEKVERTTEECKTCTDENKENDEHCRECIEK